jgi:hypothetical protein
LDQFSYLSVLLSLIVGLAITQILKGYRGIMLARGRISMYWPTLLWSASLLLMNVQSWWAMFGMREVTEWTFAGFSVVLAQTIVQYLLAAIVFPDFFAEHVDLREHYWGHTRWFFSLSILVLLISLAKDWVFTSRLPERLNVAFHLAFITLGSVALATRREWFHKFLAVATALLFCVYVVLLFARLH